MAFIISLRRSIVSALCAAVFLLPAVVGVRAQSADVRFPTPVQTNEVEGTIAARDIGDARLTDYFYTFTGVPGDLLITIECKNLNGDLDIFTAAELRPLLKIPVYAESSSAITKSIYFRKRESLILRIEARTPNDDGGTFHIRFSGSFEPISEGPSLEAESRAAEESKVTSKSTGRKGTRVSSVGARIEEPPTEVAAAPAPTPAASPATPEESAEVAKPAPSKTTRRGRASARRTQTKPAAPSETVKPSTGENSEANKEGAETAKKENPAKETPAPTAETPKETSAAESKPKPVRRGPTRRTPKTNPAAEPEPESGQRLVIEIKDGTRIEFLMNTVRSVTIYGGQIVIVGKDGKVERVSMANVARMSIGP
jgi:hypothetical protein